MGLEVGRQVADSFSKAIQAHPDILIGTVVRKNTDGTLDVAMGYGDASGAFPETEVKHVPVVNSKLFKFVSPGQGVQVGFIHGNRQLPLVLGLSNVMPGNTTVLPVIPEITSYPKALPIVSHTQWEEHRSNAAKTSSTSERMDARELYWHTNFDVDSYILVDSSYSGPARVYNNRIFVIVSADDVDSRISAIKHGAYAPVRSDAYTPQENPYYLRVIHQNLAQGSLDGSIGLPGNGQGNLFNNAHIWDLALLDTPLSWTGTEPEVIPVEMSIQPYFTRDYGDYSHPYPSESNPEVWDERCLITVLWAAPSTQAPMGGRKLSRGRGSDPGYSEPSYLKSSAGDRFFISRHLVNTRRRYRLTSDQSEGAAGDLVALENHPLYTQTRHADYPEVIVGLSSISHVKNNFANYISLNSTIDGQPVPTDYYTVEDIPCQRTLWVQALPYMPIGSPIFRGEDPLVTEFYTDDIITLMCCETTTELGTETDPACIEKIHAVRVDSVTGNITGITQLTPFDTPYPPWEPSTTIDNYFAIRPEEDVGAVPWFTEERYGSEHKVGIGLVKDCGYLTDFVVVHTGTPESRGPTYIFPRWSYSPQVVGFTLTDGGDISVSSNMHYWSSYPSYYRVYTVCGLLYVSDTPKLLIHFEEFSQQHGEDFFGVRDDLAGFFLYESGGGVAPPFPAEGDGYFSVEEWPPSGTNSNGDPYTYAFETFESSGAVDPGLTDVARMFDWAVTYWGTNRNDSTGWTNLPSDNAPAARRQGYIIMDMDGTNALEDYVLLVDGVLPYRSGNLVVEYFISEFVHGPSESPWDYGEDPKTVMDTYGPVFDWKDPSIGVTGTEEYGCVPPLEDGYDLLYFKVWVLTYAYHFDGDDVVYEDPVFAYPNSDPSYDTGEPFGVTGRALVAKCSGYHADQVGLTSEERFPTGGGTGPGVGRRFVIMRMKVNKSSIDYQWSVRTAWDPTQVATVKDLAVFNMDSPTRYDIVEPEDDFII